METKFLFCQRSPTIPATANDRNDHNRWDRIRVYLCNLSDHQRSQQVNGNHQCSDCSNRNDRNNPCDHMEIIAQRSYVSCDLNDPSDYMEINLQNCDDRSDRMFSAIVTIVNDHMETMLKNHKNRGFLQFPNTGILTTIAILMTARFTPIGRIADCSWYLLVMMFL